MKKFISSSEVSAFDCVLQSDLLAAFWLFSLCLMMFFRAVPFRDFGTVPSLKARTDCSSSLCSFWWNRNVLWCFLGTKWSFVAKRGTNCFKLRICSETNWSLMDGLGRTVPKNVFLLITREHVFIKKNKEQHGPLVLKWNQLFRVPNSERNNLVHYVRFRNYHILFLKMCSFW